MAERPPGTAQRHRLQPADGIGEALGRAAFFMALADTRVELLEKVAIARPSPHVRLTRAEVDGRGLPAEDCPVERFGRTQIARIQIAPVPRVRLIDQLAPR